MSKHPPSAGRPRTTRRRAQTRERLLAAAAAVFAERGFGRATVEDVCEAAGYTRGAFYSNFATLDELLLALYDERAGQLVAALDAAVAAAVADGGSLRQIVERVVAALPAEREHYLLTSEATAYALRHPELAAAFVAHRRASRATIVPALERALRSVGGAPSAAQLDDLARAIFAVHDGLTAQQLLEGPAPDLYAAVMAAVGAGLAGA